MERFLGAYSHYAYATMRVVLGFLFACHGAQKLFGVLGRNSVDWFSRSGLAGAIELVGGTLIMLGLLTSYAAFLASGLMAVAYFLVHAPQGFWPIQNRGELAVLYCFMFLYIAARGSVACGLDQLFSRNPSPAPSGEQADKQGTAG
ncbi:MAG: DoxX family protein [Acidobacteriota bacterium]